MNLLYLCCCCKYSKRRLVSYTHIKNRVQYGDMCCWVRDRVKRRTERRRRKKGARRAAAAECFMFWPHQTQFPSIHRATTRNAQPKPRTTNTPRQGPAQGGVAGGWWFGAPRMDGNGNVYIYIDRCAFFVVVVSFFCYLLMRKFCSWRLLGSLLLCVSSSSSCYASKDLNPTQQASGFLVNDMRNCAHSSRCTTSNLGAHLRERACCSLHLICILVVSPLVLGYNCSLLHEFNHFFCAKFNTQK